MFVIALLLSFFGGMVMVNLTQACPRVPVASARPETPNGH
jgi:hypothetical protein